MVSNLVTSCSTAITFCRPSVSASSAVLASPFSPLGLISLSLDTFSSRVAVFLASHDALDTGAAQPVASHGASSRSIMLGPPMSVFTTFSSVMLNPRPFSEVM